ncbi:TetR/AcrR family transcriptional regulator [Amycolatopsis sp. NPDC049159]|uniref:TetR/AcrR family transcriptional regulator n=1 Tax=Amycolatopsis sp. NPDC049159 TaxID=3157210 RepID=UPI0033FA86B2
MEPPSLRERTRLAVRQQLLDAALALFVKHGYEETTVDEIAAAAGMSKRSFFRYFGSKEDVILGKHERLGDQFVEALEARPPDEPLWTSLRRMFDDVVDYMTDPVQAAAAGELQRVINGSASLRAAYLDRMLGNQSRIADAARARSRKAGKPWEDADPAPLALVGSAFACLTAAHASVAASGGPLHEALDQAMAAVGSLA